MNIKESSLSINICGICKTDEKMSVNVKTMPKETRIIIECVQCGSKVEQDIAYRSIDDAITTWNHYQK